MPARRGKSLKTLAVVLGAALAFGPEAELPPLWAQSTRALKAPQPVSIPAFRLPEAPILPAGADLRLDSPRLNDIDPGIAARLPISPATGAPITPLEAEPRPSFQRDGGGNPRPSGAKSADQKRTRAELRALEKNLAPALERINAGYSDALADKEAAERIIAELSKEKTEPSWGVLAARRLLAPAALLAGPLAHAASAAGPAGLAAPLVFGIPAQTVAASLAGIGGGVLTLWRSLGMAASADETSKNPLGSSIYNGIVSGLSTYAVLGFVNYFSSGFAATAFQPWPMTLAAAALPAAVKDKFSDSSSSRADRLLYSLPVILALLGSGLGIPGAFPILISPLLGCAMTCSGVLLTFFPLLYGHRGEDVPGSKAEPAPNAARALLNGITVQSAATGLALWINSPLLSMLFGALALGGLGWAVYSAASYLRKSLFRRSE